MFMDRKNHHFKTSVLPDLIYRCKVIWVRTPASHFVDINELILELTWRGKGPRLADTILKVKNKAGGLTPPDRETRCQCAQTEKCGVGGRTDRDQGSRTESPGMDPMNARAGLWPRSAGNTSGAEISLSANGSGATGRPQAEKWTQSQTRHPSQKWTQDGLQNLM